MSDLNFLLDLVQGKIKEKEMEGTDDLDPEFIHLRKAEVSLLSKIRMEEGKRGKPLSLFVATNEALLDRLQGLQEIITDRLERNGPNTTSGELTKWEAEEALLLQQVNREGLRTNSPAIASARAQYIVERDILRAKFEADSHFTGFVVGDFTFVSCFMGGLLGGNAESEHFSTPTSKGIIIGLSLGGLVLGYCLNKLARKMYVHCAMRRRIM